MQHENILYLSLALPILFVLLCVAKSEKLTPMTGSKMQISGGGNHWFPNSFCSRTMESLMSGTASFNDKYDENEDKDIDPEDLGEP